MGDVDKNPLDAQSELEKLRKENAEFRRLLGLDQAEDGVSAEVPHGKSSLFSGSSPSRVGDFRLISYQIKHASEYLEAQIDLTP